MESMGNLNVKDNSDDDIEGLDIDVVRYKPGSLDELCDHTHFTKRELQVIYRGFKQECPSGMVNEKLFMQIYSSFFPQGDAKAYAHYVYSTFKHDGNGWITFEVFVQALSVLSRGSLQERLRWAFGLYDLNGDGMISRDEMLDVISAIYQMMGNFTDPLIYEDTAEEHVDKVFQKLDRNKDGVISLDEFMDSCIADEDIHQGISFLDTIL